jgi:TPR repeat protein
VAASDYPAAADWYRRAADAGHELAAYNLGNMFSVGRGRAWQIYLPRGIHSLDPRFLSQIGFNDEACIICRPR